MRSPVHVDVVSAGDAPGPSNRASYDRSIEHLPAYPCAKLKLDQFFLQWLSEHQDVITTLLEDIQAGKPVRGPTPQAAAVASPLSPSTSHMIFSSTPPISPSKTRSPGTPLSPQRRAASSMGAAKRVPLATIPPFYFPATQRQKAEEAAKQEFFERVDRHFEGHPQGMPRKEFVEMLQEATELPSMVANTLFRRLVSANAAAATTAAASAVSQQAPDASGLAAAQQQAAAAAAAAQQQGVSKEAFLKFWLSRDLVAASAVKRVYEVLRPDGQNYLTFQDLYPLMECVLTHHPGLEFLHETAEFQRKYSETVIHRIFYSHNRKGDGRLTLSELTRGDLLDALYALDREDDINKVLKYFSYEHFYVIYCKFWELDTDHDFMIDKNDLAHYGQCALSFNIIDRIFEQAPRRFACQVPGKMCYEDFVWFILSEEDKSTDTALEYWFRCVDLDGDGCIRPREMWHFYEEQLKRLEGLNQEPVLFEDLVCQLHDMLAPAMEGAYTLRDLKRTRPQSGLLFNALFNLHKFVSFENRDPFAMRAEANEFSGLTEWDKFAKIEYFRLASEDEQDDGGIETHEDFDTAMSEAKR